MWEMQHAVSLTSTDIHSQVVYYRPRAHDDIIVIAAIAMMSCTLL